MAIAHQRAAYERLVEVLAAPDARVPETSVSLFVSTKGNAFRHGVLVCGRAVNGSSAEAAVTDLANAAGRSALLDKAFKTDTSLAHNSLSWVEEWWGAREGYNTARSRFWHVARTAPERFQLDVPSAPGWSSKLAWSNLYKLSSGGTGNPSGPLQKLQLEICLSIFSAEVLELRPSLILFLTGWDWARPFVEDVGPFVSTWEGKYAERAGYLVAPSSQVRLRVIVARHPQAKPHRAFLGDLREAYLTVERELARLAPTGPDLAPGGRIVTADDVASGDLVSLEEVQDDVAVARPLRENEIASFPGPVFRAAPEGEAGALSFTLVRHGTA